MMSTAPDPHSRADSGLVAKRAFDLAVATAGLIMTAPAMAVIAVAVKIDSDGPVIFRQQRVGRNGEPFNIHKFRTMRTDLPGRLISASGDPRITRVGAFLRRSKLDELPQLFDVLIGAMSLVGPRPEVLEYVELWPASERAVILSIRPGITDPASIALRHEAEELEGVIDQHRHYVEVLLPRKVAAYADYVRGRTFSGDLGIIGNTFRALSSDWASRKRGRFSRERSSVAAVGTSRESALISEPGLPGERRMV